MQLYTVTDTRPRRDAAEAETRAQGGDEMNHNRLMRRVARSPEPAVVDPRLYAHEFFVWTASELTPIGSLYTALERREWPFPGDGVERSRLVRLVDVDVSAIKRRLVERVAAEPDGEHRSGAVVLRSDGRTLSVVLSP